MAIRVEGETMYEWTWGHRPRGYGQWRFRIGPVERTFRGNYGDAKKEALAYARKHHPGVFSIKVLT